MPSELHMIRATLQKDVRLLLRDRGALLSLFALPIIFIVVFGSMFGGGADRDKPRALPVWYAEGDVRAQGILAAIQAAGAFTPQRKATADEVRALVAKEKAPAGLVFPAGLDPAVGQPIELVIDQAAPLQLRGPIEGSLAAIATRALHPEQAPQAPVLVARTPPGIAPPLSGITGFQITVPGNGVLFGFFIALTVAISFAEERRSGTWRRLLASPVSRASALISKLLPFAVIGLGQLTFLFGLGALLFGMRVAGSIPALVALSCAVVLCSTSLGLAMASLGGTEKQLGGVGSVMLLVMGLLGGCMLPRLIMPPFMQSLGKIVPHAWALDGYYTLLVRSGTGLVDVAPQIGALLAFAAGFALFGVWRFRFER
jgi:ABC-2 type transport system permease protein